MKSQEEQLTELREILKGETVEALEGRRQSLHQRKLIDGLIVPGRRAQIDLVVHEINEELRRRREQS